MRSLFLLNILSYFISTSNHKLPRNKPIQVFGINLKSLIQNRYLRILLQPYSKTEQMDGVIFITLTEKVYLLSVSPSFLETINIALSFMQIVPGGIVGKNYFQFIGKSLELGLYGLQYMNR